MMQDRINVLARRVPVWAVWLLGLVPAVWTFYLGLTGGLGAEPIKALERELGEVALQLVILGLCITPLRRHLGVNLIRFRRAVGLLAGYSQAALCDGRLYRVPDDDSPGADLE